MDSSDSVGTATETAQAKGTTTRLVLKMKDKKKIVWAEDVVDNENMCKKSSKSKHTNISGVVNIYI